MHLVLDGIEDWSYKPAHMVRLHEGVLIEIKIFQYLLKLYYNIKVNNKLIIVL